MLMKELLVEYAGSLPFDFNHLSDRRRIRRSNQGLIRTNSQTLKVLVTIAEIMGAEDSTHRVKARLAALSAHAEAQGLTG